MLIDEIKKASIEAMKRRDDNARSALSQVISRYGVLLTSGQNKELTDADVINLIVKVDREIDEEIASFKEAGREEKVKDLLLQKEALAPYIPKMLGDDEIKDIILKLEDRSVPNVMKHFKANYAGSVDMKKVGEILRSL